MLNTSARGRTYFSGSRWQSRHHSINSDGTFAVNTAKIRDGVSALTRDIMTLQAEGSYAKAKSMIDTLGVIRPQTKALLDKLSAIPVDIEPRFITALDLLK